MAGSWLPIFCQPSLVELYCRSEPRFESHTGGKIKKTLKYELYMLSYIQNSVQIKKMKDGLFSFKLKKGYFCPTLTDVYPLPLDLLEFKAIT